MIDQTPYTGLFSNYKNRSAALKPGNRVEMTAPELPRSPRIDADPGRAYDYWHGVHAAWMH
jgi:hypothetical protein